MKKEKYVIKAKLLEKENLSSIVVWLSINEEDFNEKQRSENTLTWVGYNEKIHAMHATMNKDSAVTTTKFIEEFRYDYQNVIHGLEKITSFKIIQSMCMTIELFICSAIIKYEMSESTNFKSLPD